MNNQQNQSRTGISETPTIHFANHQQNNPGMCESNNVASVYCIECQSYNQVKSFSPTGCTHITKDIKSSPKDDGNQNDSYVSFIVDSGATEHLTNSKEIFSFFKNIGSGVIKCANKDSIANLIAEGKGTVSLIANTNSKKSLKLDNTIYTNK